jgi:hypothetical protein
MSSFEELWKGALRFRRVSRDLEVLLRDVYDAMLDPASLRPPLEALLVFLASDEGRTDANCSVTYYFVTAAEERWRLLPDELRAIFDDMSGTLQDSIHAPNIARTFEATPEQLLKRLRRLS